MSSTHGCLLTYSIKLLCILQINSSPASTYGTNHATFFEVGTIEMLTQC